MLPLLNDSARVPVCGLIAHYDDTAPLPGADRAPQLLATILTLRLTLRGFIVDDFTALYPQFLREMGEWLREGRIRCRGHIVDRPQQAPQALIDMLKGRNFGKALVRVGST